MDDSLSLDNLHDLALPPEIPLWPLAPGWWVLIGIALMVAVVLLTRGIRQYRANAYRREALADLSEANSPAAVVGILRRCALVVATRMKVAELSGDDWVNWLASVSGQTPSNNERTLLASAAYQRSTPNDATEVLRDYAARWIKHHQRSPVTPGRLTTN